MLRQAKNYFILFVNNNRLASDYQNKKGFWISSSLMCVCVCECDSFRKNDIHSVSGFTCCCFCCCCRYGCFFFYEFRYHGQILFLGWLFLNNNNNNIPLKWKNSYVSNSWTTKTNINLKKYETMALNVKGAIIVFWMIFVVVVVEWI